MRFFLKILFLHSIFVLSYLSIGMANTYYVDATNGSDSNTGLSHTEAWKSLTKVNNSVTSVGSDVYLLCGETWKGQNITVDWSGSSSNRVVIGSYYLLNGEETIGVNNDGKPIIDGQNSYPESDFGYLVGVAKYFDYITIQDLHVKRSNQYGIKATTGADHVTVLRCRVDDTYRENVYYSGTSNYGTVEYCELTKGSRLRLDMVGECRGWPPGGIKMVGTNYGAIRYNKVYNQWAEAIIPGHNSVCEFNVVGDSTSVGIYAQSQHNTEIAYNIVYGTDSTTYNNIPSCSSTAGDWKGNGIAAALEVGANYGDLYGIKIHHNIVINRMSGIRVYNSHATSVVQDVYIYNNYLIDNQKNFYLSDNSGSLESSTAAAIKNNISYPYHSDSSHTGGTTKAISGWTSDYNQWAIDPAPSSGLYAGGNDITTDPAPTQTAWKGNLTDDSTTVAMLTMAKLIPTEGAGNNGVDLGNDYDDALGSGSDFTTTDPDSNQDPILVDLYDVDNSPAWPIGAISFASDNNTIACTVCPPENISISPSAIIN